jgi:polar amino acid transport system ATP-binding protein
VTNVPVIDLLLPDADVAQHIHRACRDHGFFYIVGHGIEPALIARLEALSHQFFALPDDVKATYAMTHGGRAWRGWFPLGGELTAGRPDWKEGLYLGTELGPDDPRVRAVTPLHGSNLLPSDDTLSGFRTTIDEYMRRVIDLGHRVLAHLAASLGLPRDYFAARYTQDPLILFRIFQYPSVSTAVDAGDPNGPRYGVGEHTDYGLLTLLHQDTVGGLEVKTSAGWIDAPPIPGSLVCNIGDMLDRMTAGYYKSTPHRVRINRSGRNRLSLPLFFDPNFDVRIEPIRSVEIDDAASRWDGASVHAFSGSYGDYVLDKVGKVFPMLRRDVLGNRA